MSLHSCLKQRQVYSPVAKTLISVKRLKKTELEELSIVCLTGHWAVNLKILLFSQIIAQPPRD